MTLRFDFEWAEAPAEEAAGDIESGTWARFRIRVGDLCLSRNVAAESSATAEQDDWLEGPLSGLAEWIVEVWRYLSWDVRPPFWRDGASDIGADRAFPTLRDAAEHWQAIAERATSLDAVAVWQHRHTFGHASSDIALPSLVLAPELRHVVLAVDQPPSVLDPTIRFQAPGPPGLPRAFVLRKEDVLGELAGLVQRTAERASRVGQARWAEWLRAQWKEASALEADPAERRRLLLGDWISQRWSEIQSRFPGSEDAVQEILVDSAELNEPSALERLIGALDGAPARDRATVFSYPAPSSPVTSRPYEHGYEAARALRRELSLDGKPITDLRELAARIGVDVRSVSEALPFRTAVFARPEAEPFVLVNQTDPRMQGLAGWRFAVSAALGRLVVRPNTSVRRAIGAAHGPWSRWFETARANAFAAELLLPTQALRAGGAERLKQMCEEFGIAASAATWHAHNQGMSYTTT